MNNMNLPKMSTVKPKFKPNNPNYDEGACPNHLAQNFDQPAPNIVWASDFTYLNIGGRKAYLCVILDLYSRKVVAYEASWKIDTALALRTLNKAFEERKPPKGLIFHTDRGCQYTSKEFRKIADNLNIIQSFSAKGHPYDNAVMECFFKYLKKEETNRRNYATMKELELSLFQYIHGFYNPTRPHSHNDGASPDQAERGYGTCLL